MLLFSIIFIVVVYNFFNLYNFNTNYFLKYNVKNIISIKDYIFSSISLIVFISFLYLILASLIAKITFEPIYITKKENVIQYACDIFKDNNSTVRTKIKIPTQYSLIINSSIKKPYISYNIIDDKKSSSFNIISLKRDSFFSSLYNYFYKQKYNYALHIPQKKFY